MIFSRVFCRPVTFPHIIELSNRAPLSVPRNWGLDPIVNGGNDSDVSILLKRAHELKEEGNNKYQGGDFAGALEHYSKGLELIPVNHPIVLLV